MPSTWNGTASNQLITFDALKDAASIGYFDAKVPIYSMPTGNEIVTKADVETYVLVDGSTSPWASYTNERCPPKSSLSQTNYCGLLTITAGDLLNSTGNTSYPDNTVYVRTYSSTTSYTVADQYQICDRPTTAYPENEWIYYYAYDTIQYGTSILVFSPQGVSCSSFGCTPSSYTANYDANTCAGCTGAGSSVTIYVKSTPVWTPGTWVSGSPYYQLNVPNGRYAYGGRCYLVQAVTTSIYNGYGKFSEYNVSQVISSINC